MLIVKGINISAEQLLELAKIVKTQETTDRLECFHRYYIFGENTDYYSFEIDKDYNVVLLEIGE